MSIVDGWRLDVLSKNNIFRIFKLKKIWFEHVDILVSKECTLKIVTFNDIRYEGRKVNFVIFQQKLRLHWNIRKELIEWHYCQILGALTLIPIFAKSFIIEEFQIQRNN